MNASRFDIVVLDGGPAGCAAARNLSELGFSVAIISQTRAASMWEGLSRRTLEQLEGMRFKQTIDNLGSAVRRQANWNGLSSSQNTEWVVERRRFDAVLRQETNSMGVAVIPGLVRKTIWNGDSWSVLVCSREVKKYEFYCKYIIEARGRRAPTVQKGITQGSVTTALRSFWLHHGNVCAMTGVTSFADGWVWYAAGSSGRATLQLIVSGEKGGIPGAQVLGSHYDIEMGLLRRFTNFLCCCIRSGIGDIVGIVNAMSVPMVMLLSITITAPATKTRDVVTTTSKPGTLPVT